MTAEELKKAIEAHAVADGVYVLSGDSFLAEQYAEAIVGDAWYPAPGLSKAREEALGPDGLWAVVRADEFSSDVGDADGLRAVVVCRKAKSVPVGSVAVEFAEPERWQVEDYAISMCPGVERGKILWLCKACGYDAWRIRGECAKIASFPEKGQDAAFDMLNEGGAYADLGGGGSFDLADAVVSKDMGKMAESLGTEVEPMALATMLRKSLRNVLSVRMDPKPSPERCGMGERQFNFVRAKQAGRWSPGELVEAYSFLCSYDSELKAGRLPFAKKGDALAYIACRTLGAGKRKEG